MKLSQFQPQYSLLLKKNCFFLERFADVVAACGRGKRAIALKSLSSNALHRENFLGTGGVNADRTVQVVLGCP